MGKFNRKISVVFIFVLMALSIIALCCLGQPQFVAHAATSRESESNNTAATANTVSLNSTIAGNLSTNSDVDWYKFTTTQSGYFYVTFEHTFLSSGSGYWYIYLYNDSGVNNIDGTSSSYSVSGNANCTTNKYGVPAGTYYIRITKNNYSGNDYSLRVNFTAASNWETENNNTMATANVLPIDTTINGSLSMNGDVDWYKFTTTQRG